MQVIKSTIAAVWPRWCIVSLVGHEGLDVLHPVRDLRLGDREHSLTAVLVVARHLRLTLRVQRESGSTEGMVLGVKVADRDLDPLAPLILERELHSWVVGELPHLGEGLVGLVCVLGPYDPVVQVGPKLRMVRDLRDSAADRRVIRPGGHHDVAGAVFLDVRKAVRMVEWV